jgi:penicillin-binding protein 1B
VLKKFVAFLLVLATIGAGFFLFEKVNRLDREITSRFEGRRWALPARIYARPLELYAGKKLTGVTLVEELELLGYRRGKSLARPGEYQAHGSHFTIHSRSFSFSDGQRPAGIIDLDIRHSRITSLADHQSGQSLPLYRLEPLLIASIYPGDNEDRILVRLDEVPPLLIRTLLLVEDREFYTHSGIRPLAIARALIANLRAGRTVQGGSTLTQQLVKNFFLTSEKSFRRKANEAIMALLLEYHYDKDEILETYLNEIYLGQDGQRGIHGFARAARFYFGRNLDELTPDQIALLVGLAKGASRYNPRRHPQRARTRRNHILAAMGRAGLISRATAALLEHTPLEVAVLADSGISRYPAFVQLVRRQLRRDYQEEDLKSAGLTIFTSLDPILQVTAENSLAMTLTRLEKERKLDKDSLQGALVLCSVDQGEIQAVVGGRSAGQAGFNRALDMRRPIGSVVKPAVYLSALSRPDQYHLLTILYDTPLTVPTSSGRWQPHNYDKQFRGPVQLRNALIHSLNVPTVQLGMEVGLDTVIQTLHALGIGENIAPYPSLLLGALEAPPIEVLQMYQTLASGGYRTPLRSIRAVMDQENRLLQSYPLTVEQAADPAPVFCLNWTLREVTRSGTAAALAKTLPADLVVAGKTGTTDGLRDSWFAGFSGAHVAVAWVGRDDNQPTGLTGSSGALRVWSRLMGSIVTETLDLQAPDQIDFYSVDSESGQLLSDNCPTGELVPFIRGGLLPPIKTCRGYRPTPAGTHQPSKRPVDSLGRTIEEGIRDFLRIFQ